MKTRYSALVVVKKSTMQKSERALQKANTDLKSAQVALELSYTELDNVIAPQSGKMTELLASKILLESQRNFIKHNHEWVNYAQEQVNNAKEKLKQDMIEYEKFNYLDVTEKKKQLKELELKEAKDLDEVALITSTKKKVDK